jgi:hypothetical protein
LGGRKHIVPYDTLSGLRRIVSVDWKLSESPSFLLATLSYLDNGCLVSVGLVGVDMPLAVWAADSFGSLVDREDSPCAEDIPRIQKAGIQGRVIFKS